MFRLFKNLCFYFQVLQIDEIKEVVYNHILGLDLRVIFYLSNHNVMSWTDQGNSLVSRCSLTKIDAYYSDWTCSSRSLSTSYPQIFSIVNSFGFTPWFPPKFFPLISFGLKTCASSAASRLVLTHSHLCSASATPSTQPDRHLRRHMVSRKSDPKLGVFNGFAMRLFLK